MASQAAQAVDTSVAAVAPCHNTEAAALTIN